MRRTFLLCALATGLCAAAPSANAALYDDLGGAAGIQAIVDKAVPRWLADPRVGPTFAETNMDRFRRLLAEQLCQLTDGPCRYTGRSMAASHRGLNLSQMQFNAVAEDLQDAMTDAGIGFHTQNRLIAKLAPMQRDVVTR
jgi:hemoglobin